jgi:hypothetical protein
MLTCISLMELDPIVTLAHLMNLPSMKHTSLDGIIGEGQNSNLLYAQTCLPVCQPI